MPVPLIALVALLAQDPEPAGDPWALAERNVLSSWRAVGPFAAGDDGLAKAHIDETAPDYGDGARNGGLPWRDPYPPRSDHDSEQLLLDHLRGGDFAVWYLTRTITAAGEHTARIGFGMDDAAVVWVNGEEILREDAEQPVRTDQYLIDARLRAGENRVLVKLLNKRSNCGLSFRIVGPGDVGSRWGAGLAGDGFDHYVRSTVPVPRELDLEVGGLQFLPDGSLLVCTRRGWIHRIENPGADDPAALRITTFAEGLHEPLGMLLDDDGSLLVAQMPELTRLRDTDGDGRADRFETVAADWGMSGNYHEYVFGPVRDRDGFLWGTLNIGFPSGTGAARRYRGSAFRVSPAGEFLITCAGLRSPNGLVVNTAGDVFYTDNQGEWNGASKLAHLEPGDFHGHPWGIQDTKLPEWKHGEVPHPPDKTLMPLVKATLPSFKLPAVWFPYDEMGRSPAGFVWDTEGRFGPHFQGHVFVGDQYDASLIRVTLEEVNGRWQGACYPFRMGLASGVTRVAWGADRSLFVGMTNRGWGSRGQGTFGLQRVRWSGTTSFELAEMRAIPGGFELEFTLPFDARLAAEPGTWRMSSYTYELHEEYGSAKMDEQPLTPTPTVVDPVRVRLSVPDLRSGYVHELHYEPLRTADGALPLHDRAYYTLVERP
jgi:hypothetical protein